MPLSSRANARYIVQAKIDKEWVALTHQVTPEKEIAITVSTSDASFRPQFGMDVNQSALNLQIGVLEKNDAYKQWQKDHVPEVQTWFLKANTQAPDADPPPMSENVANYFAITNAISDIKSGEYSHDQLAILLKAMADFDEREIVPAVKDLMDLK
jgi:hypothetical protein